MNNESLRIERVSEHIRWTGRETVQRSSAVCEQYCFGNLKVGYCPGGRVYIEREPLDARVVANRSSAGTTVGKAPKVVAERIVVEIREETEASVVNAGSKLVAGRPGNGQAILRKRVRLPGKKKE